MIASLLAGYDFATVKAVCSAIGLVIFGGIFIAVTLWVYRPGAKSYYQDQARKMLKD
ncbi:MAG: cbb3-type cytochrome c oxidase subunit 3 [Alphaproteobacteria bacterium]